MTGDAWTNWLAEAEKRIPVGTRVRVVASDAPEYIGVTGTVADYDSGGDDHDWPLVGVVFDSPVQADSFHGGLKARDGFYCDGGSDDEIVAVEVSNG